MVFSADRSCGSLRNINFVHAPDVPGFHRSLGCTQPLGDKNMLATKNFGILFMTDEKMPGRVVIRIYAKNWSHYDYPDVSEKHVYLMPQVANFKKLDRQLNELVIELGVLRGLIKEKSGESN